MADDGQDTPGIWVPPPLVYLLALLLELLLDRRAHVPFVPRGVARVLGRRNGARSVVRSDDARR